MFTITDPARQRGGFFLSCSSYAARVPNTDPMQLQSSQLTKKDYQLLGRLLLKQKPEIAKELFHACIEPKPIETDLSRIPALFARFCAFRGISPSDYTGPLYKTSKTTLRRVFIGAILRMYAPEVYNMPENCLVLKRGIVKQLELTLCGKVDAASRVIRKVIAEERVYEDFRAQVAMTVEQLTQKEVEA